MELGSVCWTDFGTAKDLVGLKEPVTGAMTGQPTAEAKEGKMDAKSATAWAMGSERRLAGARAMQKGGEKEAVKAAKSGDPMVQYSAAKMAAGKAKYWAG